MPERANQDAVYYHDIANDTLHTAESMEKKNPTLLADRSCYDKFEESYLTRYLETRSERQLRQLKVDWKQCIEGSQGSKVEALFEQIEG